MAGFAAHAGRHGSSSAGCLCNAAKIFAEAGLTLFMTQKPSPYLNWETVFYFKIIEFINFKRSLRNPIIARKTSAKCGLSS
ncbi:hypothetical protein J34TS1_22870 [Paenibacillus azoreducens]|uniref:Uncharacterized protein n=1 Tax=Paenibacillus azoreducens TaxID=116718 RepID=A0A919YA99_9BACL|nr:hypothetical protein J34TS1_22870 [Paenibacillus azoreducens]